MPLLLKTLMTVTLLFTALLIPGCGPPEVALNKAPRPVSVVTLSQRLPPRSKQVAGSVESWKTEQIGFEVAGRVRWVLEPGEDIEGRILDSTGKVITPGTALSQIDPERYELALEAAKAQVQVAELQKASIEVSLESGIPADMEAANADLKLADVEYGRNKRLVASNATAQADLDQAEARLRTAKARLSTLNAETKQTQAQLNSAIASIKQSQQSLKDAERNLSDTTLYSAFRGQVAEVHVVPGSVVAQGTPVLTVQMMDPIKIEVELSANQSRTIRRNHRLPVEITLPDGTIQRQSGYVYMVDPSADASTRTFTLTLLMLNRRVDQVTPASIQTENLARTSHIWRMDLTFLPDVPENTYYIEQKSIRRDAEGHFVWKCVNASVDGSTPDVLRVEKMRITPGDRSVAFLGNWTFQTLTVDEGQGFDPASDLFLGELLVEKGTADEWDGDQVIVDFGGEWMLRPGDLVTVDLSGTTDVAGFYVKMDAIYEESGKTYVFVAEEAAPSTIAKRIAVDVAPQDNLETGSLRRISAVTPSELIDGMQLIVGGVHFLRDGETVRVTEQSES